MIKLEVQGHNDICGGYSYDGYASFEGKTVKEVLEEIKEYAKDRSAEYIGEGFGNKNSPGCDCWGIKINDIPYVGGWVGWENGYNHEFDNETVDKIKVYGGWYCFYNFLIYTKSKPYRKIG